MGAIPRRKAHLIACGTLKTISEMALAPCQGLDLGDTITKTSSVAGVCVSMPPVFK
jgi:hypothetical protein